MRFDKIEHDNIKKGDDIMVQRSNVRKTNLALIGLGNIGLIHVKALRKSEGRSSIVLKAVADTRPKKEFPDLLYFLDYRKLLEEKGIEAVSIATPPNTHYQIAKESLEAGKDVLLEKPPTLTIGELADLTEKASKKDLVLFTAYHTCYRPEVTVAKRELKGKEIRKIEINYGEYVLNYHDPREWIFNPEIAGGGVIIDSGINAISVVQRVLPYLDLKVTKAKLFRKSGYQVETAANVNFTFGENGKGILQMDWFHQGVEIRQIIFSTDSDCYTLDIVQGQLFKNGTLLLSQKEKRKVVDMNIEYERVYEDFSKHLTQRESLVGMKELKFVLDVYQKSLG